MSLERKVKKPEEEKSEAAQTEDGLPIVSEKTFMSFLSNYDISAAHNDSTVTARLQRENPQIYRLLRIGMENAPNTEAQAYYECGMQIVYELLRRESRAQKER